MEHTPGPWEIHSKFVGPLHIETAQGEFIALVGAEEWATCEANALLIAAAPVMLAAPVAALPLIGLKDGHVYEQVESAITKAKGKLQ